MITAIDLDAATAGVAAGGGGGGGEGTRVLGPELKPFLKKCYEIVDDPETDATVSWGDKGDSFVIWDAHAFERDILPRYFKSDKFTSFVRQLNTYGFHKVDSNRWEFASEGFLRGQKHLLKRIPRKKPSRHSRCQESKEISDEAHVKEIELLKRDKDVLMQILQQNDNNTWRMDTNKKRRLPSPQHTVRTFSVMPSDGHLIKYSPRLTETLRPHSMQESSVLSNLQVPDGINSSGNNMDVMPLGASISLTSESGVLLTSQQGVTSGSESSTDGPLIKYQPYYSQPLKQYFFEETHSNEAGISENTVIGGTPHVVKNTIPSRQEICLTEYLEELLATPLTENSEQFEPQLVSKLMSDLYLPEN